LYRADAPSKIAVVTIRVAEERDAMAIGLVHVRSWQATYRGAFPQEYLDGLDPFERGVGWQRFFHDGIPDRMSVLVADVEGMVVGFANVGPSRDEDAGGSGEVRAIYLLSDHWGRGLGRDLMVAALDALNEAGFSEATLWVLDTNDRARGFYEIGGWSPDGATRRDDRWGFPVPEVRYRRQVS
jgi:GNAT superfamily N-acetyltransferase